MSIYTSVLQGETYYITPMSYDRLPKLVEYVKGSRLQQDSL